MLSLFESTGPWAALAISSCNSKHISPIELNLMISSTLAIGDRNPQILVYGVNVTIFFSGGDAQDVTIICNCTHNLKGFDCSGFFAIALDRFGAEIILINHGEHA